MSAPTLILLPGMHGTADLFGPLLGIIPPGYRTRTVSYPTDRALTNAQSVEYLAEQLHDERDIVLIAESFSSVIALNYAAGNQNRVRAVVLCAGFAHRPVPWLLCYLAAPFIWLRFPNPSFMIKTFLSGWDAPRQVVVDVRRAIRACRPSVMARRVRYAASGDARKSLKNCKMPILCLAGSRDHLVGRRALRRILRIRPDVEHRTLDAPHLILQRRPTEAWREIDSFIESLST